MTGEKQRHHLVTQLSVTHLAAIFVARGQQHRKQIAFVFSRGSPLSNNSIDDVIDLPGQRVKTEMRGRRQAIVQNPPKRGLRSERLHQLFQSRADIINVMRNVCAEQTLHYDLQRQPHHVDVNVAGLSWLPFRSQAVGVVNHDVRIRGYPLTTKSRRR